jgi:hypothetical protein
MNLPRSFAVPCLLLTLAVTSSCGRGPRLWLTLVGPESDAVMALVEAEPNPY